MAKTSYVILEETSAASSDVGEWVVYSYGIQATSATGAIRTALDGQGNLGNRYVAVPERSWKPQSVEVKTQYHLKIG